MLGSWVQCFLPPILYDWRGVACAFKSLLETENMFIRECSGLVSNDRISQTCLNAILRFTWLSFPSLRKTLEFVRSS